MLILTEHTRRRSFPRQPVALLLLAFTRSNVYWYNECYELRVPLEPLEVITTYRNAEINEQVKGSTA